MKRPHRIKLWSDERARACSMADPCHPSAVKASRSALYYWRSLEASDRLVLTSVIDDFAYLCSDAITAEEAVARLRLMRREIKRRDAQDDERKEETDDG